MTAELLSLCALRYGSEASILNKNYIRKSGVAQLRFLRPLLGLNRLDKQRNKTKQNKTNTSILTVLQGGAELRGCCDRPGQHSQMGSKMKALN
jgi:hypothetical protein